MKPRYLFLTALLLLAAGALAAGIPGGDITKGHALARAWCASCHAVETGNARAPFADVPSFAAIAREPTATSSGLHAFLSTPHGDMPDVKLTSAELDAVVAYILSLKDK